jgi:hypothetical protein
MSEMAIFHQLTSGFVSGLPTTHPQSSVAARDRRLLRIELYTFGDT